MQKDSRSGRCSCNGWQPDDLRRCLFYMHTHSQPQAQEGARPACGMQRIIQRTADDAMRAGRVVIYYMAYKLAVRVVQLVQARRDAAGQRRMDKKHAGRKAENAHRMQEETQAAGGQLRMRGPRGAKEARRILHAWATTIMRTARHPCPKPQLTPVCVLRTPLQRRGNWWSVGGVTPWHSRWGL